MANGSTFGDVFAALATGDPYGGRRMRLGENALALQERLGMGELALDDRRLRLQEALNPTQLDILEAQLADMGLDLYTKQRLMPKTIAGAESEMRASQKLNDTLFNVLEQFKVEGRKKSSAISEAAQEFLDSVQKGWGMLAGGGNGAKGAAAMALGDLGTPLAPSVFAGQTAGVESGLAGAFAAESTRKMAETAAKAKMVKQMQQARIAEINALAQRLPPQTVTQQLMSLGFREAPNLLEMAQPELDRILSALQYPTMTLEEKRAREGRGLWNK